MASKITFATFFLLLLAFALSAPAEKPEKQHDLEASEKTDLEAGDLKTSASHWGGHWGYGGYGGYGGWGHFGYPYYGGWGGWPYYGYGGYGGYGYYGYPHYGHYGWW